MPDLRDPVELGDAGWSLDPGTLGFDLSFDQWAAAAAEAGYDLIEVPVAVLGERGPTAVTSTLRRHGLGAVTYSCPWTGPVNGSVPGDLFEQRLADMPPVLDAVAAAGGRHVSVFFNGDRPGMVRLGWDELVDRCARLAASCREHGLDLVVEHHEVDVLDRAAALLADVDCPALRLLVDSFHVHRARLGAAWFDGLPPGAVGWVHLSGVPHGIVDLERGGPRVAPFHGRDDTAAFLDGLRRAGYGGPLSIEVIDDVPRDVAAATRHAAEVLAAARAEVRRGARP